MRSSVGAPATTWRASSSQFLFALRPVQDARLQQPLEELRLAHDDVAQELGAAEDRECQVQNARIVAKEAEQEVAIHDLLGEPLQIVEGQVGIRETAQRGQERRKDRLERRPARRVESQQTDVPGGLVRPPAPGRREFWRERVGKVVHERHQIPERRSGGSHAYHRSAASGKHPRPCVAAINERTPLGFPSGAVGHREFVMGRRQDGSPHRVEPCGAIAVAERREVRCRSTA